MRLLVLVVAAQAVLPNGTTTAPAPCTAVATRHLQEALPRYRGRGVASLVGLDAPIQDRLGPVRVAEAAILLLIDEELMELGDQRGSRIAVGRAAQGTPIAAHAAGAPVFIGVPQCFRTRTAGSLVNP